MLFMQEKPPAPENRIQLFIYYALGARTAGFFVGLSTFTYGVSAIMNKRLLWLVLASLSVAACGKKEEPQAPVAAAPVVAEEKVLNVYNWPDYIAADMISNFEKSNSIVSASVTSPGTSSEVATQTRASSSHSARTK